MARLTFDALILMLLLLSLLVGVAPNIDTRAVQLGERIWPDYAATLRVDPVEPDCDIDVLASMRSSCVDTPLAQAHVGDDPFAAPVRAAQTSCNALDNLIADCERRQTAYRAETGRITAALSAFRGFELALHDLAQMPYQKHMLVLLVVLGGLSAALDRHHIALREPHTRAEHRIAQGAQLVAHLGWMVSCLADLRVQRASMAEADNPMLPVLWSAGFAALAVVNVVHWVGARSAPVGEGRATLSRLAMVVPLYAYMAMIGGLWFWLGERHPSGQAIFLHKFVQIPHVYMGIGLYIWSGMLLSQTKIARLLFNTLLPLRLPPALLGWLVIVLGAWPVAYSGASGVFVLATGAVVFEQMRAAGASHRLATAITAMSGSLGVVLRPCLIVVLISMLDNQVTTDDLFYWGRYVFLLTATLSLSALSMWSPARSLAAGAPTSQGTGAALRQLVPYAGVAFAVIAVYRLLFATSLDEHNAAFVLPAVLLAALVWDKLGATPLDSGVRNLWGSLRAATRSCSAQVGALLMMMCGSVALGGVVERSEIVSRLPHQLGSPVVAMSVIAVLLVVIGMAMDELGSVTLVSVTLAPIAAENGIAPVHFWMVVLVGFELGYLAPPVALNQLLVRQVVGRDAHVEISDPKEGIFERYSHILVPMAVLGAALVIVAYGPLLWGYLS